MKGCAFRDVSERDMIFSFQFADKGSFSRIAPDLFDLLYANMNEIAPSGYCYEEDREVWLEAVVPAMEKENRQVVLIFADGAAAGYFQYYTTAETLMMEEFQLKRPYQGSGAFRALFSWLLPRLPDGLCFAEAYAHKLNLRSRAILEHLGLQCTGENKNGNSWHFKGAYGVLRDRYCR